LTLRKSDYDDFRAAFAMEVAALLCAEDLQSRLLTDGEVSPDELTLNTAQMLRDHGPWGQSFPEPSFDGVFRVVQQRLLGDSHLKLVVCPLHAERQTLDAIAFNIDRARWPDNAVRQVRLVYRLDINEYRGERNLQLMVEHIESV
ncbi:MAG: single-stranded-DNA-specific exonuclease RecJ, partial [Pseudohongiellaceae bacterium]